MIKNKGMFYSGLVIFIIQALAGLTVLMVTLTKGMTTSQGTANVIFGCVFFGLMSLVSIALMIIGATQE